MAGIGKLKDGFRRFLGRAGTVDYERYRATVTAASALEAELRTSTVDELAATAALLVEGGNTRARFCAAAREAATRTLGLRPFDVQLMGALALLDGQVVEMNTGEGKTLTGAIAAAGFAAQGHSIHVLSVNDYLARRDAEWMAPFCAALGFTVGWIAQDSTRDERREAYGCDVTYVSVSEAGFDVLRDRLRTDPHDAELSQPDVVIVDEVDAVLVDEAIVPLVLAGSADAEAGRSDVAALVAELEAGLHFEVDADARNVALTERGVDRIEELIDGELYSEENSELLTAVNVALHAQALLHRDVDYVVRDGRVELVSAERGRVAKLQRWPDGLHAAVEAKEGLVVSRAGVILDSTTVRAVIRRYPIVGGMSGTAVAVAQELYDLYSLACGTIPPNVPCIRIDEPDRLYSTAARKNSALVEFVQAEHETGRPVLVGTQSVAESERLAATLAKAGVPAVVLNAKNDAEEAAIIARAGEHGRVTISTQMAGRGTDIRLGGVDGADRDRVVALGGLCVVGLGRYHSVRLDDQLRGRAGRQGDPGSSVFFTSVADELVQRNAPDTVVTTDPDAIDPDGRMRDRRIEKAMSHAQRAAEGALQVIHENTLRYSDLVEHHRSLVLDARIRVLDSDEGSRRLRQHSPERYAELEATVPSDVLAVACRAIVLFHLDERWSEHLAVLADAREGIHLRSLARDSPIGEFNKIAIREFHSFVDDVDAAAAETFLRAEITDGGLDPEALGLKRPSATWTYMVTDNPFGSPEERFVNLFGGLVRKATRPD